MKGATHARESQVVQPARPVGIADRARQLTGWATVEELAEELRFTVTAPTNPLDACRAFLRRKGIAGVKRGRRILVSRVDIDAALRKVS